MGKKVRTKLIVENNKPIRKQPMKTKSKNVNESSDEYKCFCLICVEPYSNSRASEKWIKRMSCNDRAHEECAHPQERTLYARIVTQTMNTFKF